MEARCLPCPWHMINRDLSMDCSWYAEPCSKVINCPCRRDLGHDYSLYRDIAIFVSNI